MSATCEHCRWTVTLCSGAWIDSTAGDVCGVLGGNEAHVPILPTSIRKVRVDAGGYLKGRYFGAGSPLYQAEMSDGDTLFFRGYYKREELHRMKREGICRIAHP